MNKTVIACVISLAVSSHAIAADTATQLVLACQSLKRQDDRNTCLAEAVKAVSVSAQQTAAPAVPQVSAKDEAQARAAKALTAAQSLRSVVNSSGVSLLGYGPYVQQLAIAIDQYRAVAQLPEENRAIAQLDNALEAYSDAATFWESNNTFYAKSNNRFVYGHALPSAMTDTGDFLTKYHIPRIRSDLLGIYTGAPLSTALTAMWAAAGDDEDAAKDALAGIGAPPKPIDDPDTQEWKNKRFAIVKMNFVGGTFAAPDLSSAHSDEQLAGKAVYVSASRGTWARVSRKGETEQWLPFSDLGM
jgi:hypothetical protein